MAFSTYSFELKCDYDFDDFANRISDALSISLKYSGGSDEIPTYEFSETLHDVEVEYNFLGVPDEQCESEKNFKNSFSLEIMFVDENYFATWHQDLVNDVREKLKRFHIQEEGWLTLSGALSSTR